VADLIAQAIERALALQPSLNIFTQIEESPTVRTTGPLAGIPVALKDLIDHEGRVTTAGSAFYRAQAQASATVVDRLEEAGATIIGRTGLHEFAFGFSSENPHFGPVRNPWDPTTSTGGSSGGSGAAVSAGIVPIAIGTDTGGSVRVPAALCGCYGLKPTFGAIPTDGVFPLVASIDTVGPLADSVSNLESAYRVMARDDRASRLNGPVRIGVPQPWYEEAPIDPSVARSFIECVDALREMGHEVHPIQMPDVLPSREIGFVIAPEVNDVHHGYRSEGKRYGDDIGERLAVAAAVSAEEIDDGRRWQEMIRSRFADAFATVDYLLTPTVPALKKVIGADYIGDVHYRAVLSWFTAIVNQAGLPAISLPLNSGGTPPPSIQVIGPARSEPDLLALGLHLEEAQLVAFRAAPQA
jgi:aspartyl-tRNA(Asn)/glutamyl-tRNA(Gln) amidotransferase subunit A